MRIRWPALVALAAALAACDAAAPVSTCVPGLDPSCEAPPVPDEVVAGVNVTALFAAPSQAEVDSVLVRPTQPTPAALTIAALADGPDGARRFLLALEADGQRVLSALARVPGDAGAVTRLPVVGVLTDGTDGASAEALLTAPAFGPLIDRAVQVVVAYRGEALTVDGTAVPSALAPDPYRADVADVLALVAALEAGDLPRADLGRLALVGVGRGGTVALLAALAAGSPSVGAVVTLGAPTDLFAPSFAVEVRARLTGGAPAAPYPALDALAAPALALRDEAATPAEARLGLLALSPARLLRGAQLPPVLALHAEGDAVVGDDQLASLAAHLAATPSPGLARVVEGTTHAGLADLAAVQSEVASFLLETL